MTHKTCKQCGKPFTPARPLQAVCSPTCAHRKVKADKAAEKKADKAKKAKLRSPAWHKAQAQKALNAWIVHGRDKGRPCISCGAPAKEGDQAGHYRTRGSAPHLALDERNLARQCVRCNLHLHGNPIGMRAGMVARYGEALVLHLETDQAPRKRTAAEHDELAAHYRAALRKDRKD